MYPAAKSKADDIIVILSKLSNRSPSNRFHLRQYKKDAEAIAIYSPIEGNTVLGAIACMIHDNDAMHKYHKLALNYSGRSSYALINYGISLTIAYLWDEALAIHEEAYKNDPSDLNALDLLINAYFKLGLLDKSVELLDAWAKLSPGKGFEGEQLIRQSAHLLQSLPITITDINGIIISIAKALSLTNTVLNAFRLLPVEEGAHKFLHYELVTQDADDNPAELELIVEDILSDESNKHIMDYFTITFCCKSEESIGDSFDMASEESVSMQNSVIDFNKIEELIKDVEPL